MKILNIRDYECEKCGLPSAPGICEHCRITGNIPPQGTQPAYLIALSFFGIVLIFLVLAVVVLVTK